jgi:enediyne biosynthesis protein E4
MVDMTRGSTLLHNEGSGFTDVSEQAGVRDGQWGWDAEFLDYDNDGRLDLFTQNGFIRGQIPDDV